ncbi:calcium/sodium antiporter [Leptospira sp. GIMC2001]|uniref:calcium/sodium antiporter n=1 Tax=Leptospira sp. GIMC2001 TaxID=1513297 RepID=UPI00234A3487|nr:calcium/sodium antiporter [Leptospira sp. GIMC2001]WCL49884.1 calcium/sodium antiporter [Leptospira sp. GIMC2001]
MEEWIIHTIQSLPMYAILAVIVVSILTLGKGADLLVDEAVVLSLKWGVPKILIGATIVSLGTTLPEATVSVMAAMSGNPDIALGNAVGSIICDTGLILGIAILISPPTIDKALLNRQGLLQFGSGLLLILACLPYTNLSQVFTVGGNLPQAIGFVFLFLLALYMYYSIKWATKKEIKEQMEESTDKEELKSPTYVVIAKLALGVALVILSSKALIPAVEETAIRFSIPKSIISATLVAFGTSLPELVTAISAARKGHGELALGNIIGADILNVLFVAGAAAAVTTGGLKADESFFIFFFPAMLFVLVVFRLSVFLSKQKIQRPFGFVLLGTYLLVTVLSYFQNMK